MADRCAVIITPLAGGYTDEKRRHLAASLEKGGLIPEVYMTGSADDPERIARQLCAAQEHPFMVVCGGDGTVNGVLNGLTPGAATLAVVPLGTANVLARELAIRSVDDAVGRIVRGMTRPLAVGLLRGEGRHRFFFLMAGIGVDGAVVAEVRDPEKRRYGKGAYLLAALRLCRRWDRGLLDVTADGARFGCHTAVVCNARRYGGGFVLAPGADIFTPGFQLLCVGGRGRSTYLRLALATATGKESARGDVRLVPCREVTITGRKAVQVDGDHWGESPVTITAVGDFARLIV